MIISPQQYTTIFNALIEMKINEGYKEAVIDFSKVADKETVDKVIASYKDLVNRNQVQGNEKNIDYWRKQGYDAFSKFVGEKSKEHSATQIKRKKVAGKSITVFENDKWLCLIPLDKEASCFHGKDSDWCTTKVNQSYFEKYFYDKGVMLIYCIMKTPEEDENYLWAIAAHEQLEGKIEMFDQQDSALTEEQFYRQTGIKPSELVNTAFDKSGSAVSSVRDSYNDMINRLDDIAAFAWASSDDSDPPPMPVALQKEYIDLLTKTKLSVLKRDDYDLDSDTLAIEYLFVAGVFPENLIQLQLNRQGSEIEKSLKLINTLAEYDIILPDDQLIKFISSIDLGAGMATAIIRNIITKTLQLKRTPSDKLLHFSITRLPLSVDRIIGRYNMYGKDAKRVIEMALEIEPKLITQVIDSTNFEYHRPELLDANFISPLIEKCLIHFASKSIMVYSLNSTLKLIEKDIKNGTLKITPELQAKIDKNEWEQVHIGGAKDYLNHVFK